MTRRGGVDLARDAEALLDELLEAPAGAVAGEHAQVVQVEVAVAVGVGDLLVIDLAQPVVGGDGAGVGEDQAAHGIGDGGVLLDAPVSHVQIFVDGLLVVKVGGAHVAQFLALLAVQDVGLGDLLVAAAGEHGLYAVLNVLHGDLPVLDLFQEVSRDLQRQKIDDAVVVLGFGGFECFLDGFGNLRDVEIDNFAVAFYDLIHVLVPLSLS